MRDGRILAALALWSVPVLLIVILVKVCGLENKVADLTKKVGGIDLTRRNGAAENIASRDAPAPKASGWLSAQRELQSSRKGPRDAEAQRGLELGAKPPAPQTDLRVSASPRDASPAPSTSEAKPSASTSAEGAQAPTVPPAPQPDLRVSAPPREIPKKTYEPTAFDMFWMRVEDWLAVRGDFAPKGMTHEFAFATRWLIRIGVALIVGAIIYFVKLSIDRGWMGPTGRVAATLFWGLVG